MRKKGSRLNAVRLSQIHPKTVRAELVEALYPHHCPSTGSGRTTLSEQHWVASCLMPQPEDVVALLFLQDFAGGAYSEGLPVDEAERLHKEMVVIVTSAEVKARYAQAAMDVAASTSEKARQNSRAEFNKMAKVVRDAGIRGE